MQFIKHVAPKFNNPRSPIVDSGVMQIFFVLCSSRSRSSSVGSQDVHSNNLHAIFVIYDLNPSLNKNNKENTFFWICRPAFYYP